MKKFSILLLIAIVLGFAAVGHTEPGMTGGGPGTTGQSGFQSVYRSNEYRLMDTDRTHYLRIIAGSDLTANRIITLTTGDAARTITLSGNPTLADWFDQAVKTSSTPTFASQILSGNWYQAASTYHNWGTTLGTTGYGIFDDSGTMKYKNSGGAWTAFSTATSYWSTDTGRIFTATLADNIGVGFSSAFGTSAAKTMGFAQWTAPTTSPADIVQIGGADEGDRAGYTQLHMRNEAGQNGAIAFQAPLVNLLPNSGFGVWSNATLENVGSQLVASWTNADYDTFTSTGADIDSAIYSTSGTQDASSAAITLVSGKLYKVVVTLTLNSGQAPTLAMTNLGHTSAALTAGANTFVREATSTTTTLTVSNTAAANWSATFTLYEVTPGTVAASTLGPDGWYKDAFSPLSNLKVWRQHTDATFTKDGNFYSLKIQNDDSGNQNGLTAFTGIFNKSAFMKKFAGKKVTFGAWIYGTEASKIRLRLGDGVTDTYSSYHTGGSAWEWIEVSKTISASLTQMIVGYYLQASTAAVYISQPMLVFGAAIGAGNYASSTNEAIYLEKVIALTDYTATTGAADATVNLETQSSGMIPKGAKAVLVKAYGKDSAAGDGVGFDVQSASGVEDGISIDTQVNNIRVQGHGWVKGDANGDIYFDHRGSGSSALTIDIKVIGVQP